MLSQTVEDAFNEQANAEMYSSYLYLSMSAHFASQGLNGIANWMRQQSVEEWAHAMKFFDFVLDRGGRPKLHAIDEPPSNFGSPAEVFDLVVGHEEKVTGLIHALVELTTQEKDHASGPFLAWFVSEQVEEEKSAGEIRDQLRMIGDQPAGLMMMDRALAARVAPATA
jgi:ferritin